MQFIRFWQCSIYEEATYNNYGEHLRLLPRWTAGKWGGKKWPQCVEDSCEKPAETVFCAEVIVDGKRGRFDEPMCDGCCRARCKSLREEA